MAFFALPAPHIIPQEDEDRPETSRITVCDQPARVILKTCSIFAGNGTGHVASTVEGRFSVPHGFLRRNRVGQALTVTSWLGGVIFSQAASLFRPKAPLVGWRAGLSDKMDVLCKRPQDTSDERHPAQSIPLKCRREMRDKGSQEPATPAKDL